MMKVLLIVFILLILVVEKVCSQTYNMSNSTVTTCSGTFYDSGGACSNYGNNQNRTMTFCSGTGQTMIFNFTSFNTEANYDILYVYDGPDVSSPLIGTYHGNLGAGIGTITSSGTCLTFRFTSDGSVTRAGWVASISCGAPVVPPDCLWEICLYDSYGDGWNGGSVVVYVDGSSVGTFTGTGYGPNCFNVPIHIGDDIFIDYTAGSWSTENEYILYDSHGNIAYSSGVGGTTPADYTFSSADCDPHPVTPNEQDCLGAIPICGNSYSTTNSYTGAGNIPGEINGSISCLLDGERNDVWYVFTVQQNGNLMFTISPNNPSDDYDWAVFNLTNSTCSDIATDPSLQVSCNYSGTAGDTGPDGSTAFSSQGSGGTPFNAAIPVLQGEVYVINISNWSSTQNGYFIDFSMSSGVVVDTSPPELDTIVNAPTCGQNQLTFWFNELVDTSSVSAGYFSVTGPGGTYNVVSIAGTGGAANEREFIITLDAPLIAGGTYTLTFSGQVNDPCGNIVIGNSLNFNVIGIVGSVLVDDGSVLCYDDAVGSATASATGGSGNYSYLWDTGATTATITNLPAGSYVVTISDDVGVCYDIVTAIVNASNSIVPTGTWAGSISSDWYDCQNWGGGYIPLTTMDVIIPGGCPNYPVFSVNTTINSITGICNSIQIQNGATFTVNNDKNLIINNSTVRVETGGSLYVAHELNIISGGTLFQSGGNIYLNGDFNNHSNFISNGGTFFFTGSVLQSIDGSQISTFSNLTVNNSTDGLKLDNDAVVNGNLTFIDGDFDLQDFTLDLGTTGVLVNETENARIKATDGSGMPVPATGVVTAVRNNPTGNVAGLGLNISPLSPLGNTTIIRGHDELIGSGSFTSNSSILRYYEVIPGSKSVTPCNLTFNYFDVELNGHIDGTLEMFQEVQFTYGGVPGPVYWSPQTTANNALLNTADALTIDNNLTKFKVTLASSSSPLPVSLTLFEGKCNNDVINLIWNTSSEVNNDFFILEVSTDGVIFSEVARIKGAGYSNHTNTYIYSYSDFIGSTMYFRLSQTDYNGHSEHLSVISVSCVNYDSFDVELIPFNHNTYNLIVRGCPESDGYYYLTDQLGRLLKKSTHIQSEQIISLYDLNADIYNLFVFCNDHVVTKKVLKY